MAVFSKGVLSGSAQGRGILVTGTATTGMTTIHTGPTTGVRDLDEVYCYAVNTSTDDVVLTMHYGLATLNVEAKIPVNIPAQDGLHLVVPGLVMGAATTANVMSAFAGTANVIAVHGYVHQVS